ncbi:hypothetical protein SAMN05421788_113121 [Filimonas lacunae]|uniref:Uncharacterized protein n=1 Tax=Filimonas lacunae TaxID=477680 RepID=A0A173MBI7_9BACT|nr:hypothetical protein [Filimonas lacunae]BAV04924.1 hypothetical protein FLA_0924 [Filimonas lacunae]SIT33784.1 hypothetical protein SAMN05421788_113121 [Filimonas lacunae]
MLIEVLVMFIWLKAKRLIVIALISYVMHYLFFAIYYHRLIDIYMLAMSILFAILFIHLLICMFLLNSMKKKRKSIRQILYIHFAVGFFVYLIGAICWFSPNPLDWGVDWEPAIVSFSVLTMDTGLTRLVIHKKWL